MSSILAHVKATNVGGRKVSGWPRKVGRSDEQYGDVVPLRGLRLGESLCLVLGDVGLDSFLSDIGDVLDVFILSLDGPTPLSVSTQRTVDLSTERSASVRLFSKMAM